MISCFINPSSWDTEWCLMASMHIQQHRRHRFHQLLYSISMEYKISSWKLLLLTRNLFFFTWSDLFEIAIASNIHSCMRLSSTLISEYSHSGGINTILPFFIPSRFPLRLPPPIRLLCPLSLTAQNCYLVTYYHMPLSFYPKLWPSISSHRNILVTMIRIIKGENCMCWSPHRTCLANVCCSQPFKSR